MSLLSALRHRLIAWKIRCRPDRSAPIAYRHAGKVRWINADKAALYHIEHSTAKIARLVEAIPLEPRVVFDVGANCGLFAAFTRERFPLAKVFCFEPAPAVAALIPKNCGADVRVLPYAIDEQCGRAKFYVNAGSQQTNSLLRSAADMYADGEQPAETDVEVRTLDAVCRELAIGPVDVLKLDIQGTEFRALAGGRGMLSGVSVVFLESTWMEIESITRLIPFAREAGFNHLHIVGEVKMGADIMLTRVPLPAASPVVRSFDLTS